MSVQTHPVQTDRDRVQARAPQVVTLRAYEVYREIYGEQAAIIQGECRGGFGAGELIAFLYARSFPRQEWKQRFDEALRGMVGL